MYLGKRSPKFFPAGPFIRMLHIKCLTKCPYFQKPPLPSKIPGYALELNSSNGGVQPGFFGAGEVS